MYIRTKDKLSLVCFGKGAIHSEAEQIFYQEEPEGKFFMLGVYGTPERSKNVLDMIYLAIASGKPSFNMPEE